MLLWALGATPLLSSIEDVYQFDSRISGAVFAKENEVLTATAMRPLHDLRQAARISLGYYTRCLAEQHRRGEIDLGDADDDVDLGADLKRVAEEMQGESTDLLIGNRDSRRKLRGRAAASRRAKLAPMANTGSAGCASRNRGSHKNGRTVRTHACLTTGRHASAGAFCDSVRTGTNLAVPEGDARFCLHEPEPGWSRLWLGFRINPGLPTFFAAPVILRIDRGQQRVGCATVWAWCKRPLLRFFLNSELFAGCC